MRYLTHLECSYCRQQHDAGQLIRLCPDCGYPLLARYDLLKAAVELDRDEINARPAGPCLHASRRAVDQYPGSSDDWRRPPPGEWLNQ